MTIQEAFFKNIIVKILVGFLVTFIIIMGARISSIQEIMNVLFFAQLICFIAWGGNEYLSHRLESETRWSENTYQLIWQKILVNGVYTFLSIAIPLAFYFKFVTTVNINNKWEQFQWALIAGFATSIFLNTLYAGVFFFQQWKVSLLETERLKRENMQASFEVLKSQLNPHFMFNSLNTLTALIAEDQEKALRYVRSYASVYRHILTHQQKEWITLKEEVEALEHYIQLLKERFEDNLSIDIEIPTNWYHQKYIPPLSLQMLLENCIKHNIISKQKPLTIQIKTVNEDKLTVANTLQLRSIKPNSTQIGLKNIIKRYELLGITPPLIQKNETHFIVQLTVLKIGI